MDDARRAVEAVLGITAARMAWAFLVPAATIGQRLVRAKTKIRDAGIPFEVPDDRDLAPRLDAVLEAIYAAFGLGWDDGGGELAEEAIWLGRVLVEKRPNDPERSEERRVGKECRSLCDWSSDVCSSDLSCAQRRRSATQGFRSRCPTTATSRRASTPSSRRSTPRSALAGTTAAASWRRRRSGSAGCSSRNDRTTPRDRKSVV